LSNISREQKHEVFLSKLYRSKCYITFGEWVHPRYYWWGSYCSYF